MENHSSDMENSRPQSSEFGDSKPHPSELLEFTTKPSYLDAAKSSSYDDVQLRPKLASSGSDSAQAGNETYRNLSRRIPGFKKLAKDAKAATKSEHTMTFMEGLRLYPKAIGWSILLSLTIVMEGFDITLCQSLLAFPQFKAHYGELMSSGNYQISTVWQAAITNGAVVGEILGLLLNGYITHRIGNRYTMIGSLIFLTIAIFLAFFAHDMNLLLASQVLCGLPWGVFQTLSLSYAAEVMPVALRAYVTSNVNNCWLIGQLISVGMLRALINEPSEWSYRIPFALQWMWTLPILVGVLFCPESPWWLIQHSRPDDAKRSLTRLTKHDGRSGFQIDETVAMMEHTNEVEKYHQDGTSYLDCFRGTNLRRTEIACVVWFTQSVTGAITGYSAYFFVQAGLPTDHAFDLSVGMYGAGIAGGLVAWFLMRGLGRRTLYMWGSFACATALTTAGIVGFFPTAPGASWLLGGLIVTNTFIYDSTIGPVCYSLVAEIPSTRLRVKTVVLARVVYNIGSLITNVLLAKMLNPTAWDFKGKSCLCFGLVSFLCSIWCYFRLPEPKGLTYMELDIMFEKDIAARKFKKIQHKLDSSGYFCLNKGANPDKQEWLEGYEKKVVHIS